MESKAKRMRSANWDSSDKILLRQLIEERIEIVENKSVDTNTTRKKKDAWLEITNIFNNMSATTRETSQLQSQWRTIKMKAKTKHSAYKRSLQTTGGGPPPKSPDAEDDKLMALIPQEFEEDENIFDCDTQIIKENLPCQNQLELNDNNNTQTEIIIDEEFEDVLFLEDESPKKQIGSPFSPSPSHPPPALDTSNRKKKSIFKRKINCKDDEHLKKELFNTAVDNRRAEKIFMEREHEEKMKSILMERNEKIKTLQMERAEKEKTLLMERKHKEEIHKLKLRRLEEENFNF